MFRKEPTTQALLAEVVATASRLVLSASPKPGLGTCVHLLPFQCRRRDRLKMLEALAFGAQRLPTGEPPGPAMSVRDQVL